MLILLTFLTLGVALSGPVPDAIERSVRERMGEVSVRVVELTGEQRFEGARVRGCEGAGARVRGCEGAPRAQGQEPALSAIPEPGSRLGRQVRFILVSGGARVGSVVATLEVTGAAVRASRAIPRGEAVESDAIEVVDVDLAGVLLRRLPSRDEVVGALARRQVAAGELLSEAVVMAPPTVKSGDQVSITLTSGPVQVTGVGRASGSGRTGDLIRVLVPSSRKPLKARITGPGSVEIVR